MAKLTKVVQLRITWLTPPKWPYAKPGETREQTYPIDDVNVGTILTSSTSETILQVKIEEIS